MGIFTQLWFLYQEMSLNSTGFNSLRDIMVLSWHDHIYRITGTILFSLFLAWISLWTNNRLAGDSAPQTPIKALSCAISRYTTGCEVGYIFHIYFVDFKPLCGSDEIIKIVDGISQDHSASPRVWRDEVWFYRCKTSTRIYGNNHE